MKKTILFPSLGHLTKRNGLAMRLFTASMLLMLSTISWAYDFKVDGIFYNINGDGRSVSVTRDDQNSSLYMGQVVIPSTVSYKNTTYNVTNIGTRAFWQCSALTSIEIPNSVSSIGEYSFGYCAGLTSIDIPNSVTSIGYSAFQNTGLISVEIPNSVTSIAGATFTGCASLVSVEIPNSVTDIGQYAFRYCSALISVKIPNSVTNIEHHAFQSCSNLTSIELPNTPLYIDDYAFSSCPNLVTVVCLSENVPPTGYWSRIFAYSNQSSATLYVPASAIDKYKSVDPWRNFGTILPIEEKDEEETTITISIGKDGLATYSPTLCVSSGYDYYIDFTKLKDKIAAYRATIDGNTINLTRTYKVYSSEGVLLRSLNDGAVEETITVELIEKASNTIDSNEENNAFVGVKTDTYLNEIDDNGNTNFVLSKQTDGTIGFYKVRDNTLVKAGKAYLPVPNYNASASAKGLTLVFDDATGIIGVQDSQMVEDGAFYTLSGVRVANPKAKGIYIHNGKKVIIK